MTCCSEEQLTTLIRVARLSGLTGLPPAPAERKEADTAFIRLTQEAVNAGDVLFHIALSPHHAPEVRLNAVFAVQPLLTRARWAESTHFQNREAVVGAVAAFAASPPVDEEEKGLHKIRHALLECLAHIVANEYPSQRWRSYVEEIVHACLFGFTMERQSCPTATGPLLVLQSFADVASENGELWLFLAGDVASVLGQRWLTAPLLPDTTAVGSEEQRMVTQTLRYMLLLMQKRPRPSIMPTQAKASGEEAPSHEVFLLSAPMATCVSALLDRWVLEHASCAHTVDGFSQRLDACDALLRLCQRLIKTETVAEVIFQRAADILALTKDLYLDTQADLSGSPASVVENALECLLNVLQVFPRTAERVPPTDLLNALISFMIPRTLESAETFDADSAEELRALVDAVIDDESIPLGCNTGDIPALTASVLELYLDAYPFHVDVIVDAIQNFLVSLRAQAAAGVARPALLAMTSATGRALRAAARVCTEGGTTLMNAVSPHVAQRFYTAVEDHLLTFVLGDFGDSAPQPPTPPHPWPTAAHSGQDEHSHIVAACLLEALSLCFAETTHDNTRQFALAALADKCYARAKGVDKWICVLVVGRLMAGSSSSPTPSPAHVTLLNGVREELWPTLSQAIEWLHRALSVAGEVVPNLDAFSDNAASHLLPLYCGGMAICALLNPGRETSAGVRGHLVSDPRSQSALSTTLCRLCSTCQTQPAAELLRRLLKLCGLHECGEVDCQVASTLQEALEAVRKVVVMQGHSIRGSESDSTRFSVVVNAISGFSLDLENECCFGQNCSSCATAMLNQYCLPILVLDAQHVSAAFDDGGARARCAAIVTGLVALEKKGAGSLSSHVTEPTRLPLADIHSAAAGVLNVVRTAAEQKLAVPTMSVSSAYLALISIAYPEALLTGSPLEETGAYPSGCTNAFFSAANAAMLSSVPVAESAGTSVTHSGGFNFVGQWLLQCVQLIVDPRCLTALLLTAASQRPLGHARSLFSWGCSLLPFADEFTALYSLAAFARIISLACDADRGVSTANTDAAYPLLQTFLPSDCPLCYLPSVLVKSVPATNCIYGATIAEALGFALVCAKMRRTRTNKVKLIPDKIADLFSALERVPHLTNGEPFPISGIGAAPDLIVSGCDALLAQLAALGFAERISAISAFVTQRLSQR